MDFNGNINKVSFPQNLKPLFEAMQNGKTIKSVTCMAGQVNKNDRSKDFMIENFVATDYWQGMQSNYDGTESFDYVDCETESPRKSFYMNWVLSFSL